MKAPSVGSPGFKCLAFHDQLELVSLKLFNQNQYHKRVGEPGASPSSGFSDPIIRKGIQYPDNPVFVVEDLPVAFLVNYWAGYMCSYREEWYLNIFKGATPLDEYDIKVGYMENLRTFTFPMLSVSPALQFIIKWVSPAFFRGLVDADTLTDACKVYIWLALNDRRWGHLRHDEAERIYMKAMVEYQKLLLFDDINGYYPMIEEGDESSYLENEEFVLCPKSKFRYGRYFYPMIPNGMYATPKFSIKDWGFVDKRED